MKEPRLRSSADELLVHPWIAQIPKNKVEQSSQLVTENVLSRNDRDAMLNTIKLYEKEKHTSLSDASGAPSSDLAPVRDDEDDDDDVENWDEELGLDAAPQPLSLATGAPLQRSAKPTTTVDKPPRPPLKNVFQLSKEDAQALLDEDVWDEPDDDSSAAPLRTMSASAPGGSSMASRPSSQVKGANSSSAGLSAALSSSWDRSALVPTEKRLMKLQSFSEKEHDAAFDFDDLDEARLLQALSLKPSAAASGEPSSASTTRTGPLALNAVDRTGSEDDDADFDDLLDSAEHLTLRLSKRDLKIAPDATEAFPDFDDDLGFDSLRDSNQKATTRVVELLALLDPSMDDQVILDACMSLVRLWRLLL